MFRIVIEFLLTALGLCPTDMALAGWACMDRFEAPNQEGAHPLVMQSAEDGNAYCESVGKRLCTEAEWDAACEASSAPCNNDKQWRPWDRQTVNAARETARLWQGSPSGAYPACRTWSGIFDLQGNVEEWVVSEDGRDWPFTLKGGWWAKRTACRKSNDAHEPTFRFYETGFRCCAGVWPLQ